MNERVMEMRKSKVLSRILLILLFCMASIVTSIGGAAAALPVVDADTRENAVDALQKLAKVKNCHMTFDSTISLVFKGQNMNIRAKGEADILTKPTVAAKTVMTVASSVNWIKTEQTFVQYIEEDRDQLIFYTNENDQWVKSVSPYKQPATKNNYDYDKMIAKVAPKGETAEAKIYEVTVSGTYLRQVIDQMTAVATEQNTKLAEDILPEIGDFTYLMSIDKKSAVASKFEVDLTEFLYPIGSRVINFSKLPEEKKKDASEALATMKASLSLTVSQFNSVKPVVIPPEVKKAAVTMPSGPSITIGANLELSGGFASYGNNTLKGVRLAVKEVNNAGGVLGRPVELAVEDNASQPSAAATAITTLINRDKVIAVIGAVASSNTLAAAGIAEEARIPMISPASTNPKVTVDGGKVRRYVFRGAFVDPYQGKLMANFASGRLGARAAAVIIDRTSEYSKNVALMFNTVFIANGGRIVAQEAYLQKDQDFRAQLMRVQAANPDVIFIPGYYNETGYIIRQARELGILKPLLGADGWDSPRLIELAGIEALHNTYFSNHYSLQNNTPANQKFRAAYKKEYGMEPDAISALGYDTALLLLAAIKQANSDEPEKIRDALEGLKFEGVTGPISFDAWHNPVKTGVVITIINGKQTFFQKIDP